MQVVLTKESKANMLGTQEHGYPPGMGPEMEQPWEQVLMRCVQVLEAEPKARSWRQLRLMSSELPSADQQAGCW